MKRYENPALEIIDVKESDIITASPGTTGPTVDEESGDWGIGIGV